MRSQAALSAVLAEANGCIVDLTSRAYDGVAALAAARGAGVAAIAVGQHDNADLLRAARAAGAVRVLAYRSLFEHADRDLGGWIRRLGADGGATRPADGPKESR